MDRRNSGIHLWARLVLVALLIALSGLSAVPFSVRHALSLALRAQAENQPLVAARHLSTAAALQPWRADLWLAAGRAAFDGGDYLAAVKDLTRPGVLNQLQSYDLLDLGDAYLAIGDAQQAQLYWRQAIHAGVEQALLYRRLLDLHEAQEDLPAQVQDLKSLLTLDTGNASYYLRLGRLLSALDPNAALAYLAQAQIIDNTLKEPALKLQDAIRTGQLASDPAYPFLQAGRVLATQDEWELAKLAFQNAVNLNPTLTEAWAYLGEAIYHVDPLNLADARQALDQAINLDHHSLPANAFTALYWQRQGKATQALPYMQQVASLQPENPLWQASLGQTFAIEGDLPAAQLYYEKAVSLAPDQAEYHRLLAEFFLRYQIRLRDGALPAAREALRLEPDDPATLDILGQVLMLVDEVNEALTYFHRAIQASPDYAPALLHLGVAYMEVGDNELAYEYITKAQSLATGTPTGEQAARLLAYFFP